MIQYITADEYIELLRDVVKYTYEDSGGSWHPEDIASNVDIANRSISRILSNLPEGKQLKM